MENIRQMNNILKSNEINSANREIQRQNHTITACHSCTSIGGLHELFYFAVEAPVSSVFYIHTLLKVRERKREKKK